MFKESGFMTKCFTLKKYSLIHKVLAMALMLTFLLTGCGSGTDTTTTDTLNAAVSGTDGALPTAELSLTETALLEDPSEIVMVKDGKIKNPLTGCWIDEKYLNKRPISVQIENTTQAIPQYGLSYADIIYEMYTEGGITRLMPIFTEYDKVEKFEPMRSNRHYYDRKAVEYDTVHVFCGASDYANQNDLYGGHYPYLEFIDMIRDPGLERDTDRFAPHNAYTTPVAIDAQIEAKGFSRKHRDYYTPNHLFNDSFKTIDGSVAEKVTIPFYNNAPWFEYDEEDQVYYRYQFWDEQIDYQNYRQLYVTNILIQLVTYRNLEGYEEAGSQDITWEGSGEGFYCTGGKVVPVTWSNQEGSYTTRWYDASGNELKLNPGKTWIAVYKDTNKEGCLFEVLKKEEDTEENTEEIVEE